MSISEGSRYEGVPATKIVEEDGTVKRFLHDRPKLNVNNFAKDARLAEGDELDLVAYVEYDDESLWWTIADANEERLPLDITLDLEENTKLNIPAGEELRGLLS